jgi:cell division protein FtsX
MATTMAEYYNDELVEWNRLIAFNDQEMDELEHKLAEVIQRNTIPNIAAKVEVEQHKLNSASKEFYKLRKQIQQQEATLKTDSTLIDDSVINPETEKQQNELRLNMRRAEKEFVDSKYDCYNFLSQILRK